MERIPYDSFLKEIAKLDDWLGSLGISVKKDRWHEAVSMVRQAKEQRQQVERGIPFCPIPNYVPALFEALEVLNVFRAFSGDSSLMLREKLLRALSGPSSPAHEKPDNSAARNAMFELMLAADWKNLGADVKLGEPDIEIVVGGAIFRVECKRPFSARSVRRNIEDAAGQLSKALEVSGHAGSFGLVAVSLSRFFNLGGGPFLAAEDSGRKGLNDALIRTIENHKHEWKWNTARFHERIASVAFYLAVPWDINRERLIYLSTTKHFLQAKCPVGSRILRENMDRLYAVREGCSERDQYRARGWPTFTFLVGETGGRKL
jgi:hypothetical protein